MAWKDLRSIKEMPLGMALGTVSKMITGQNLNIKPRQLKKLKDEKLEEFYTRQEEEREKLFMIFANHFTAPEDVEEAREDFWGFVNYIYGTHTLRTYINDILAQPDIIEALIEIYFKDENKIQELTYALDRRTSNVKAFGKALEQAPAALATLLENHEGNNDAFIEKLAQLEAPAPVAAAPVAEPDEELENRDQEANQAEPQDVENNATSAEDNRDNMKEAV